MINLSEKYIKRTKKGKGKRKKTLIRDIKKTISTPLVQGILTSMNDIGMTNRDMSKFTTLIMTGVTAMVRGTAQRMENHGISYPGEKIADILREAYITHISNEVPFVEGCNVFEDRFLFFCSRPEYIELLEYVGADVI